MIKISVVTAVRNRESQIETALQSIQKQTHSDVEHIIQDGLSTDGTLEVVARYQTEQMDVLSEKDSGIYDAINRGIRRATGDVIGLMHSDDFFASDTVLAQVATAFADPEVDGVYGDLDYVAADDTTKIIRRWRSGPYTRRRLRQGWMPPHPTLYLRRAVFDQWGLYDASYQIAADYDAMLRYLEKGRIQLAYIPEVLVKMRLGGESNRDLARILRKSREDLRAIRTNQVGGLGTLAIKNLSKIRQFF